MSISVAYRRLQSMLSLFAAWGNAASRLLLPVMIYINGIRRRLENQIKYQEDLVLAPTATNRFYRETTHYYISNSGSHLRVRVKPSLPLEHLAYSVMLLRSFYCPLTSPTTPYWSLVCKYYIDVLYIL